MNHALNTSGIHSYQIHIKVKRNAQSVCKSWRNSVAGIQIFKVCPVIFKSRAATVRGDRKSVV